MNRKQFSILLVLVVVIGALGLVLSRREKFKPAGDSVGKKLLGDFPVNDVAHFSIKRGDSEVNLVKKDELWRVRERGDHPANYGEISDVLLKLRDLKIIQTEQVGASQLPRLELAAPGQGTNSGTLVEFKDSADKTIKFLLLGKKHTRKPPQQQQSQFGGGDEGWPDGRWVKLGDAKDVALISEPLSNVEPKPEQWLNKDFFKVERVRSIAVDFTQATNSWKLMRETESAEWKLSNIKTNEQLDSGKVSSVSNPLSSPTFNDVLASNAPPETTGLDKPNVATLETFDNFTYTVKVGKKSDDNYFFAMTVSADLPKTRTPGKDEKPEDKEKLDKQFQDKQKQLVEKLKLEKQFEKWIYLVSSWTVDPLLKERSQLFAEKKEDAKEDDEKTPEP